MRKVSVKFWLLTPTESGFEASDFENDFEEEEEEEDQQHHHHHHQQLLLLLLLLLQQASADIETQATTSGVLPTWGPPQGRNTNIHPFVRPAKGVKKVRLHTSTKTAHHCLC